MLRLIQFINTLAFAVLIVSCDDHTVTPTLASCFTLSVTAQGDSIYLVGRTNGPGEQKEIGFLINEDSTQFTGTRIGTTLHHPDGRFFLEKFNNYYTDKTYYCRAFWNNGTKELYGRALSFKGQKASLPEISDFTPASGTSGDIIKIFGTGFSTDPGSMQVSLGNRTCEIVSSSIDRILVIVPKYSTAGPVSLKVEKAGYPVEAAEPFVLNGPEIISLSTSSIMGKATFTISGQGFSPISYRNRVRLEPIWLRDKMIGPYDLKVTAASEESLTVEIDGTDIPPQEFPVSVTVNDVTCAAKPPLQLLSPWEYLSSKPESGLAYPVSFRIDNKLYFCTGAKESISTAGYTDEFWEFDITANTWTRLPDFPGGARVEAIGFAINGKGYVGMGATGKDNPAYMRDLWEYNPATGEWTEKASLPPDGQRSTAISFSYNNKGYIALGLGPYGMSFRSDFWSYDPELDIWTELPDFDGHTRSNAAITILGDKLYIIGGFNSTNPFDSDVWCYDFVSAKWSSKGLVGFQPIGAFSNGDKCYVLRGVYDYFGFNQTYVTEYNPELNELGNEIYMFPGLYSPIPGVTNFDNGTLYFGLGVFGGYGECISDLWKYPF